MWPGLEMAVRYVRRLGAINSSVVQDTTTHFRQSRFPLQRQPSGLGPPRNHNSSRSCAAKREEKRTHHATTDILPSQIDYQLQAWPTFFFLPSYHLTEEDKAALCLGHGRQHADFRQDPHGQDHHP